MKQFLIALDQLANTLVGGYADETLSARAHRVAEEGGPKSSAGSSHRATDSDTLWQNLKEAI